MWLAYALGAAGLWSVGGVLAKRGLEQVSPIWNNIISSLFGLVLFVPVALVAGIKPDQVLNILPGLVGVSLTNKIYYYAIAKGEISLVGTVAAAYPVVTVILSTVLLGEIITDWQKMGVVTAVVGIIVIGWPGRMKQMLISSNAWLWWGVTAAVLIGTGDFLANFTIDGTDVYTFIFLQPFVDLVINGGLFLVDKRGRKLVVANKKLLGFAIAGASMIQAGLLSFNLALERGLAALVTPVSSIYPAITVVLAMVWLKEKVSLRQLTGIALAVGGVLLLAFKN